MAINVPGLSGFVAAQDQARAQQMNQLQQAQLLMGLRGAMEGQAREQAFRSELAGLGPNATMEQRAAVAAKYAPPKDVLEEATRSADRKAAAEDRASQFAQNLSMRQQALDQQREAFFQRTEDARARQAFEEFYKRSQLQLEGERNTLNAELRRLGLEITRQGQQMQISRFDAAERDRRDRAVTQFANNLQENKIPALSASITTANDLLKNYEDKDIPGLGLFVGSKFVPNMVRTEEANRVRSSLQAVSNDLLNLYSGLAVTLPEAERRELEEMKGGNFTSEDFKNAWPRIVNRYNTVVGNLKAGANAEVLKEYGSRPGSMKLDPLTAAFSEKKGGPKKGDVVDGFEFLGGNPADQKNWRKK